MNKNYRLNRTAIVTALDASNASPRGSVWTPTEKLDIQEADALVLIGVAEETKQKPTLQTVAERMAGQPAKVPLSGIVDATRQEDGTFVNKHGKRVNEDGSDYEPSESEVAEKNRAAFINRPAAEVIADVGKLTPEQVANVVPALIDLETNGKGRSTVLEALNAAAKTE